MRLACVMASVAWRGPLVLYDARDQNIGDRCSRSEGRFHTIEIGALLQLRKGPRGAPDLSEGTWDGRVVIFAHCHADATLRCGERLVPLETLVQSLILEPLLAHGLSLDSLRWVDLFACHAGSAPTPVEGAERLTTPMTLVDHVAAELLHHGVAHSCVVSGPLGTLGFTPPGFRVNKHVYPGRNGDASRVSGKQPARLLPDGSIVDALADRGVISAKEWRRNFHHVRVGSDASPSAATAAAT